MKAFMSVSEHEARSVDGGAPFDWWAYLGFVATAAAGYVASCIGSWVYRWGHGQRDPNAPSHCF